MSNGFVTVDPKRWLQSLWKPEAAAVDEADNSAPRGDGSNGDDAPNDDETPAPLSEEFDRSPDSLLKPEDSERPQRPPSVASRADVPDPGVSEKSGVSILDGL